MKRWVGALALVALLGAAAAAAQTRIPPTKETSAWWGHIAVIAASDTQGRQTGSDGYLKAADYVAGKFREYGLKPGGVNGYYQPIDFEVQVVDQSRSSVVIHQPDGAPPMSGPDMFVLSPGNQQPADVDAPLVFIGYGVHLPQAGHDDFAGVDLKGKVAVLIRGGPSDLSGSLKAYASTEALAPILEAKGALGLITVSPADTPEGSWKRVVSSGSQPGMYLSEPALRRFHAPFFAAIMNPAAAQALFNGADHTFAELGPLAEAGLPLPPVSLKTSVSAKIASSTSHVASPNVVGVLPGSDPALAGEAVVLSAHLDHLGMGAPDNGGDGIFHGVMDNAAGVASMLEIARALQAGRAHPKRTLIFLALTGEEKGLLGSRFFASRPSVFAGRMIADINIDMFLPLYPLQRLVAYGDAESTLGDMARNVAAAHGVAVVPDPAPDRFIFIRSDQYAFIRSGVPAIMFEFAGAPGSPEEQTSVEWRVTRYHTQADDLAQAVDLAAAEDFDNLVLDLLLRVADEPVKPTWRGGSLYRPG
jgi:Zn-dependent M28 family amino/carboxypeptidase